MKIMTLKSVQTYIEEGEGGNWTLIPAQIWGEVDNE